MKTKNTVAEVLKVYAVINFIAGIALSIIISQNVNIEGIGIYFFAASLIISFIIFAFGEVVQLLHDIRSNTEAQVKSSRSEINELPEL